MIKSSDRFMLIDALRGLSSLWILCFHVLPYYIENEIVESVINFGRIGTDFFFVTSGYVTAISCNKVIMEGKSRSFILERLKKIYLIYFFSLIIAILVVPFLLSIIEYIKTGAFSLDDSKLSFINLVQLFTLIKVFTADSWHLYTAFKGVNAAYWFIAILVQIYLFIGICLLYKKASFKLIITMFFISALSHIPNIKEILPYGIFIPKFTEFFFGMALWWFLSNSSYNTTKIRTTIYILSILGVGILIYFHSIGKTEEYYRLFSAFTVALVLYSLYPKDKHLSNHGFCKIFNKIGKFSYSIYLNHIIFWPIAIIVTVNISPLPKSYTVILLTLPFTVFLCFLYYCFFERQQNFLDMVKGITKPMLTLKSGINSLKNKELLPTNSDKNCTTQG